MIGNKRSLSVLFAVAAIILLTFSACQSGDDLPTVSMYDLRSEILQNAGTLPDMLYASNSDANAELSFAYIADMDYSKTDAYFVSYASDGSAYEFAVIAVKNASDVSIAKKALEDHLQDRIRVYENYLPAETARASGARVIVTGRYAALIMCDSNDLAENALRSFVGRAAAK